MTARDQLRVRVNDELVLDAGTCEEVSGPHGPERLIRPPSTTLFHRVLGYLRAKPDPPKRPSGTMVGLEGVAAAALVLRWGSYLVVLLDHDKPLWPQVHSTRTSRISDKEMARINIEVSAALAEWGRRRSKRYLGRTASPPPASPSIASVTRNVVGRYERGKHRPRAETLDRIARLAGVTTDWLRQATAAERGRLGGTRPGKTPTRRSAPHGASPASSPRC